MRRDPRLRELGAFLRARRGEATPGGRSGIVRPGRRQVPGLRREEVAALVHVSTEYYTRIEQGRMAPSRDLVRRLATALHLDDGQLTYALELLDHEATPVRGRPEVDVALSRVLDRFVGIPALVIGPNTAILEWNAAATDLFFDFARVAEPERSFLFLIFTDPTFQSRFRDLVAMQAIVVGIVRSGMAAAVAAGAPVPTMVDTLGDVPAFRALWERHDVTRPRGSIEVPMTDPGSGDITVDLIALSVADDPTQRVLLFNGMS